MADEDDRTTSMQFCQECNNLMYPREVLDPDNPQDSRLVYVCKAPNCVMSSRARAECSDADSTLVWKHVVQHTALDEMVNTDIKDDPTQPRTNDVICAAVASAAAPAPLLRCPRMLRLPARLAYTARLHGDIPPARPLRGRARAAAVRGQRCGVRAGVVRRAAGRVAPLRVL
jgi:DNA-directed RNA polymerase subunit M/transcription elongation factor TFIIS